MKSAGDTSVQIKWLSPNRFQALIKASIIGKAISHFAKAVFRNAQVPTLQILTANRTISASPRQIAILNRFSPKHCGPTVARLFLTPRRKARSVNDQAVIARGTPIEILDGIFSMQWGDGQGGKVLLVHGWESRATHLAAFIKPLVESGKTVIGFDGPAHGDSEGKIANVYLFAKTVMAIGKKLGSFDAVIGHSMGAASSLYALAHGFEAKSIVHIAGPGALSEVLRRFSNRLKLSAKTRSFMEPAFQKILGVPIEEMNNHRWAKYANARGMIVHDPDDQEIPFREAEALAASWPGVNFQPVNGVGHTRILRAPFVVSLVTNFVLQENDGTKCSV
jgi:pimeloyl-ACP methyl ester carboxylesterase